MGQIYSVWDKLYPLGQIVPGRDKLSQPGQIVPVVKYKEIFFSSKNDFASIGEVEKISDFFSTFRYQDWNIRNILRSGSKYQGFWDWLGLGWVLDLGIGKSQNPRPTPKTSLRASIFQDV